MPDTGTERSPGSVMSVHVELPGNDGRSANTGFHNGVSTGGHQQLGIYFLLDVGLWRGQAFRLQQANPELSPQQTTDGSKNTSQSPCRDRGGPEPRWHKERAAVQWPWLLGPEMKHRRIERPPCVPASQGVSHRGGLCVLTGRVWVWAWWHVRSPSPHEGATPETSPVFWGTSGGKG